MMTVKFHILGVGLLFEEDKKWRGLLPFDDTHNTNVYWKKNGDPNGEWGEVAGAKRTITVTTENAESSYGSKDDFNKILDLTSKYIYKEGIELKTGWRDQCTELFIENAVMEKRCHQYEDEYFLLCEYPKKPRDEDEELRIIVPPKPYARYATSVIEIANPAESGSKAFVRMQTNKSEVDDKVFEYEEGATYDVFIDNDCEPLECEVDPPFDNDFQLYYKIIEDKSIEETRYALVAIPEGYRNDFPSSGTIKKSFLYDLPKEINDAKKTIMTTKLTPCHIVRSSQGVSGD